MKKVNSKLQSICHKAREHLRRRIKKNLPKKETVTQTWMTHKEQLTVMDLWHELFLIFIRKKVAAGPSVSFSLIALDY